MIVNISCLEAMTMKIIDFFCSIWNAWHLANCFMLQKSKDRKQKAFRTDDLEIRYACAKRYYILCMNCANGIVCQHL